jgi:hypothetical protein
LRTAIRRPAISDYLCTAICRPAISDYLRAANRCLAIADYLRCGQLPGHSQYCAAAICCYLRPLGHLPQLRRPFVVRFAPPRPFAAVAFTEDQMVAWENKTMAQQTWAALQTYFTDKRLERKQYSATTAKQSRFKEAALLAQETAAAEEEGESQAMLFAMLQVQHNKQIAAMTATNKANMDTMMDRMNALVTGKGDDRRKEPSQQPDKENTPPDDTNQSKRPRKKTAQCPHCKKWVLHKFENCTELEANKDKRRPGWKSVNTTA